VENTELDAGMQVITKPFTMEASVGKFRDMLENGMRSA
jgi:hypothetical protein